MACSEERGNRLSNNRKSIPQDDWMTHDQNQFYQASGTLKHIILDTHSPSKAEKKNRDESNEWNALAERPGVYIPLGHKML